MGFAVVVGGVVFEEIIARVREREREIILFTLDGLYSTSETNYVDRVVKATRGSREWMKCTGFIGLLIAYFISP